jgi:hypothetical protein
MSFLFGPAKKTQFDMDLDDAIEKIKEFKKNNPGKFLELEDIKPITEILYKKYPQFTDDTPVSTQYLDNTKRNDITYRLSRVINQTEKMKFLNMIPELKKYNVSSGGSRIKSKRKSFKKYIRKSKKNRSRRFY